MVFLEKNHHAVGQLDPLRLLGVKLGQGWDLDLLPVRNLSRCPWHESDRHEEQSAQQRGRNGCARQNVFHCAPPLPAAACLVSMIPMVRLSRVKVWAATRRISALVTASILSTDRNNSRQ